MTPDFVVQRPWGYLHVQSEREAVDYAKANGFKAFRLDYDLVSDGWLPHEQVVRTLLWEPQEQQEATA